MMFFGVLGKAAVQRMFGIIDGSRLDENYVILDSESDASKLEFGIGDSGKFAAVKFDGTKYAYTKKDGTMTERFMLLNGTLGSGTMAREMSDGARMRTGLYVVIPVDALDGSGYMTLLSAADKAGPGGRIKRAAWSSRCYLIVKEDGGLRPHLSETLSRSDLEANDWITLDEGD